MIKILAFSFGFVFMISSCQEKAIKKDQTAYAEIVSELKERLTAHRIKYKDDNDFLPEAYSKSLNHLGLGANITLEFPFSPKYSAGGPNALADGLISIDDLSQTQEYGVWQGFEENDLIAILDLKKEISISSISVGFLQNTDAWIFSPEWVEFSTSNDNIWFKPLDNINRTIPENSPKDERIAYSIKVDNTKVRYIKLMAKNVGRCPSWYKGAGHKAWLFADEIIIE